MVVFDWDGTIVDSAASIVASAQAAAADAALPVPASAAVRAIIGLGLREAIEALYPGLAPAEATRFIEAYRAHFSHPQRELVRTFAGVPAALEQLHGQGVLLTVATGKGRRGLDRELRHTGLAPHFHASRCADECRSKPHPQMLEELLALFDLAPGEALMVGDTAFDLDMARHAGVDAVAVSYGAHDRETLLRCRPLALIDHMAQLFDHL